MPSEFYPGVINPLKKKILKQNINIDTRFRDNYFTSSASNFHVDLPLKLSEVVSLQLSAMELPTTFYVISKAFGNNFFVVKINDEIEPLVIELPDGNYDYLGLEAYINTKLTDGSNTDYNNISCSIDITDGTGNGKMKFTGTGDFSIIFNTDICGNTEPRDILPLKLGWMMGFRDSVYNATNDNSYVVESEGIVNLLGPKYIYLVVNDYNNNGMDGFYGAFTSSILNKNILARISLQGSVFNYLTQNNFNLITSPRQYFGPVDIQKLHIQLLDEYGRILNLNYMDYSFCLTFQTIYDM